MFRITFTFAISLFHSCARAHLATFSSAGPISPYIGSIPTLVNTKAYDQILRKIMGPFTNYNNGFFWPPPRAFITELLVKDILQSSGLAGLGVGGLNLNGMGLSHFGLYKLGLRNLELNGLDNISTVGLLEKPSDLGFAEGIQVIQVPLLPPSSTLQQCQVPC